ncbi:MAG: SHOCT domain-containing protein [Planctomycetota bacterium]|nr:SHOCT domain-containing protein [Planctomycetota bacterium]
MCLNLAANLGTTSAKKIEGFSLEALMWLMLLLGAVLIGGFVILAIRRRYHAGKDEAISLSFNLATLRQMRDRGELTEEEFQKACEHLHRDAGVNASSKPLKPSQQPQDT